MTKENGIHYLNGELQINLNKNFFKDIYETNNIIIGVDGYLILNENISDSIKQETLEQMHKLYNKHGISFVKKIKSGIFNLVLYDKKLEKIFIVSDQFGGLSLYYSIKKPFEFSSNIRNLNFSFDDWYAISQFLKYGHIFDEKTQDKFISVLEPHSILEYDIPTQAYKKSYYAPDYTKTDDLKSLFKKACDRLYCNEIDYRLALSGGCDSRFILYNWKNKKDLTIYTYNDIAELGKEYEVASKLIENVNVKEHLFFDRKMMNKSEIDIHLHHFNPFDIRKLNAPDFKGKIVLSGDMAPTISGEFYFLRSKKFALTALTGHVFSYVSKDVLNKAITRIPQNALQNYITPQFYKKIEELPLQLKYYIVEDYHVYNRTRRWTKFSNFGRLNDYLLPFLDYDVYFNYRDIKNRVNNKLYYPMLQSMPKEYKIKVTRYAYPLTYPRRLQYASMIWDDFKRHIKPNVGHFEEIGFRISKHPEIHKYMIKSINDACIVKNISDFEDISGGKLGYFFFQLFLLSHWFNQRRDKT